MKTALAAIVGAIAFTAGLNLPMPQRTYEFVRYHGTDSAVLDYGLSIADCVALIPPMRDAGLDVICETE